jgi:thiol-disulfide isomerase/thioredoxin
MEAIYGELFDFENAIYVNQRSPISLKCLRHNKIITKEPQVFLRGSGCNLCAKEKNSVNLSRETLDEIKNFVSKLNGKCLSKTYLNNETKLEFACNAGHKFQKSWSAIKNSLRWCPKCSPNKLIGETLARLILEHLLKMNFPSVYIKEMEGLQLDGYNSKNSVAFEYQGYQHFTEKSHFHIEESSYKLQIERDKYKKELCKKNHITLIEIFEFKTIRLGRIQLFVNQVKNKLNELNLKFNNVPFELDLVELYRGKKSELYEQAKKIVEKKNGILQEFIGSESKHIYTCSKGHKTTNRVLSVIIKSKASCSTCESNSKYKELKDIIESRGGKLIDKKLKPKGYSEIYKWICNNGHKRDSKGQYLFDGYWCVECQKEAQKKQINAKQLAEFKKDVISGEFYQKDIPKKYGLGDGVYRRIVAELGIKPKYILQDKITQKKRTKGKLFQIDPENFEVIKEFESLEAVKHDPSGNFKPEGIRFQMKKYNKAYGYFWCRENTFEETIKMIKLNTTNNTSATLKRWLR